MDNVLFVLGDFPVTLATAIAAGVALMALLLIIGLVATMQASQGDTPNAGLCQRHRETAKHEEYTIHPRILPRFACSHNVLFR